jgi:hypothetical protein
LTSGKTKTSLLEQLRVWQLTARRVLATDHPDQPKVGADESLPGLLATGLQQAQLVIGRIAEAGARQPGVLG